MRFEMGTGKGELPLGKATSHVARSESGAFATCHSQGLGNFFKYTNVAKYVGVLAGFGST